LAVVLWMSASAMAVLVDDFESYSLGSVNTVTTNWKGTVDVTIETDPANPANKVIRENQSTVIQKGVYCILSDAASIPEGATKTLFLRFRATDQIDSAFGYANTDAPDITGTNWDQFGPQVSVLNGVFRIRNGTTGWSNGTTPNAVAPGFAPLQWYNLWMVVDNAADIIKVYVHGRPGDSATEADVVKAGTQDTFGFRHAVVGALTRFYWRAQNTSADRNLWIDDIYVMDGKSLAWPISVKGAATNPKPADKATDVQRDATLSWTPGPYAKTHNVYFGTVLNDVNTAKVGSPVQVGINQDANTFNPGRLTLGQTYYWRVDEVNAPPTNATVFTGSLWTFTVEPVVYEVPGVTATASSSDTSLSPTSTINKSGLTGDLHGTDPTTMWLSAKGATGPAWLQYDLGKVYKLQDLWVWNYNVDFEELLGMGIKNATIQYSTDGASWTTLGSFDFAQGISAVGYAHNTTIHFGGVGARYVKITANSSFGGKQYGLSEVRFYYFPVSAREPNPATGSTGIAPDATLSWRAGREAASHKVYMGTDPNVLTLAGTATTNSFAPVGLSLGTTYYWRVDEVNTAATPSTWASDVWSFTTNPFITVDDMESYNDSTNQIFNVWVDGYGTINNGSVVGLNVAANGTFGSTTIFHAGKQSMPFAYNNTGSITNSEATRTFDSIQDWTRNGVKTLTLYFYGQPTNTTTVPFWVKLTDQSNKTAKVIFGAAAGEDTLVLADPAWATWNIPLSGFTGITLSKVKSMTIGVGTGTGSGTLYIDDIRLYPAVTTTTITPTMVGWWKLDNNVQDSSGAGNNGTIVGTPTYVAAGKIGASLKLNGTTDYVDCGNAASLNITDVITLSAWVKPATFGNSAYQTLISKGDNAYVLAHTNTNLLQLAIYDSGAWYSANSAAVTTTFNGSWHHVAGTFDGTQIRVYVDGKMAGSVLRTGVIATDTYVLSIGRNSQQATRLVAGEMDDVRIYHGVLPTSEIVKLANP
jgi:hypothetical protein